MIVAVRLSLDRLGLAPVAVALVAVLSLAACDAEAEERFEQNDDVAPVPGTVVAGLAVLYAGDDTAPEVVAEGECFAAALTDRLTLDELVEAELVQDDGQVVAAAPVLDVDVASAWVDSVESCAPFVEVSTRALATQSKGRLDQPSYAACLGDALDPAEVRTALVATLTGRFDSPEVQTLSTAQADCAQAALPED